MTSSTKRLRVVASTPVSEDLIESIVSAEPRIDFVRNQSLLAPKRFAGDHSGDPEFPRTREQQQAFEELVDSAEALYGVPESNRPPCTGRWRRTPACAGCTPCPPAGAARSRPPGWPRPTSLGSCSPRRQACTPSRWPSTRCSGCLRREEPPPAAGAAAARRVVGALVHGLISQQRILLVGLGSIGRATATKLKALGATVVGTSRSADQVEDVDEIGEPRRAPDAVADVDGIVVSLPGTAATEGLVGAKVFAAVKPGVTIVSVGRGTVVDEDAMTTALVEGRVGLAALDVFAAEPLRPTAPCGGSRTSWSARTPRR